MFPTIFLYSLPPSSCKEKKVKNTEHTLLGCKKKKVQMVFLDIGVVLGTNLDENLCLWGQGVHFLGTGEFHSHGFLARNTFIINTFLVQKKKAMPYLVGGAFSKKAGFSTKQDVDK